MFACIMFVACESSRFFFFFGFTTVINPTCICKTEKQFSRCQNVFFHNWCVVCDGSQSFRRSLQDGVKTKHKRKETIDFSGNYIASLLKRTLKWRGSCENFLNMGIKYFYLLICQNKKKTVYTKNRHSSSSTSRHSGDSAMLHSADILDTFWIVMCW